MSQVAPQSVPLAAKSERPVILRAQGIKKAYHMGEETLTILKHVDLTLREGEFVAIEGRSGSGKSTLLHIMSGLDAADSGKLEFRGQEYAANPPGLLYPTPFRRLLAIPILMRLWVYTAIILGIMAGIEFLNFYFAARVFIPLVNLLVIALSLWFRWERRLLILAVVWIVAGLGWLTYFFLGSALIGVAAGIISVIGFGLYLAACGYFAERPVCRLRTTEFGFVFQFYHLLPELSVLENALMSPMIENSWFGYRRHKAELTARATQVLKDLGLGHRLKHKPSQLSGGERQRVAIARALMNNPKVLFADEPTGNLDVDTGRQIMGVLEKLHRERGQTIVMVTHDRTLASQADRALVLRQGRLERPGETPGADKTGTLDYH
jgi:ABC-type lipoprotein export system ATPase subunit